MVSGIEKRRGRILEQEAEERQQQKAYVNHIVRITAVFDALLLNVIVLINLNNTRFQHGNFS